MTLRHVSVLVLAAAVSLPSIAQAQGDEERAAARAAATQGVKAYEAGNHQDAVNYLERAESLVHSPIHLLYLARANEKLGRLVQAREAYLKVIREPVRDTDPQSFRDAQASAHQELKPLEPRIPSVTLKIEGALPEQVSVSVDGKRLPAAMVGLPLPINPGEHLIEVSGEAIEGTPQRVNIAEGTHTTTLLKVRPRAVSAGASQGTGATNVGSAASGKRPVPTGVYIGLAATGVLAAGGAVTAILSSSNHSEYEDVNNGSDPTRASDLKDKGETLNLATDVFFGGALIAGGITAVLYFTRPEIDPAQNTKSLRVTPALGSRGGSLSLSGRF